MRKVCLFVLGIAVALILSNLSFAVDVPVPVADIAPTDTEVVVEGETVIEGGAVPAGYPSCCGHASTSQIPQRPCARQQRYFRPAFAPAYMPNLCLQGPYNTPTPYSYPCPQSGFAGYPAAVPVGVSHAAQGGYPAYPAGVNPATAGYPGGAGNIIYRPTPIRNFVSLLLAPRPYVGYDPYAGAPYAY